MQGRSALLFFLNGHPMIAVHIFVPGPVRFSLVYFAARRDPRDRSAPAEAEALMCHRAMPRSSILADGLQGEAPIFKPGQWPDDG